MRDLMGADNVGSTETDQRSNRDCTNTLIRPSGTFSRKREKGKLGEGSHVRVEPSRARAVVEADLVDHLGSGLAVLGDLGERQSVRLEGAPGRYDGGWLDAGFDRIFEDLLAIKLLSLVAGQDFHVLHRIVLVGCVFRERPPGDC